MSNNLSFSIRFLHQHGANQLKEEESRLRRVREDLKDQKAGLEKKKQLVSGWIIDDLHNLFRDDLATLLVSPQQNKWS